MRMHFKEKHWPLHTALGWVLTRDPYYADRYGPDDFWPYLPPNVPYEELTDEHKSWRLLFDAMTDGRVPTFGRPADRPDGENRQLSAEDLEGLDWGNADGMPGLRRRAATQVEDENRSISDELAFADVHVSSNSMFASFWPLSDPIAFGTTQIGPPQRPVGPDFMALSAAAYWIATKGGTFSFFASDEDVWISAYKDLLFHIVRRNVKVIGRGPGNVVAEEIEGIRFTGIEVNYPYSHGSLNSIFDHLHLECACPITTDDWDNHNDCLRRGTYPPALTHLQVRQLDIARFWKFSDVAIADNREIAVERVSRGINKNDVDKTYQEWVDDNKKLNLRTSREVDIARMRLSYPAITDGRVRKLRKAIAPKSWTEGGRPRTKD